MVNPVRMMGGKMLLLVTLVALLPFTLASRPANATYRQPRSRYSASPTALAANPFLPSRPGKDECPPCFNCQLPAFSCANSGSCRSWDGQCDCPVGFGGQDCLSPLCGSPLQGEKRFPRKDDDKGNGECDCDEGWGGLNCNVCQKPSACADFTMAGERLGENGTCYTGGSTVMQSFQQCDVTNKKITEMLPGRPPKVTFSCKKDDETCNFQVSRVQQAQMNDPQTLTPAY